jgi:alkylmercury lyase
MINKRTLTSVRKLTEAGGVLDYGSDLSGLLVRVMHTLAQGHPVAEAQISQIIADLGVDRSKANQLLSQVAERDESGNIAGIMGLSLNKTTHRLNLNGTRLYAWCAMDTLFLPAVLGETVTIESRSPVSREFVRLTISPKKVEEFEPAGAVLSFVVVEPEEANMNSVESIWNTFCHHIYFFASRAEAEQWAGGRKDIEILPVEQAHELGKMLSARFLAASTEQSVA